MTVSIFRFVQILVGPFNEVSDSGSHGPLGKKKKEHSLGMEALVRINMSYYAQYDLHQIRCEFRSLNNNCIQLTQKT